MPKQNTTTASTATAVQHMTPEQLQAYLTELVKHGIDLSTMIWGPPGIGKSSIVAQIAAERHMGFVDVRLSQLAPTDLRGIPVPQDGLSHWFPPEFLPREGTGILFLDEINMAPPAMQGMAQQLILDRRVGSYSVPDGWFIWAAGNRKEDRASVFDMPAPLANRFLHLSVQPDFESFKRYALLKSGPHAIHEQIIAFLAFRPEMLHKVDLQQPSWPSPRSWEMASRLHTAHLSVVPAIGAAMESEFAAYLAIYQHLPDLDAILRGNGKGITWPVEPSQRYAVTTGLTVRSTEMAQAVNAFKWIIQTDAGSEWLQLFMQDLLRRVFQFPWKSDFANLMRSDPEFKAFEKVQNRMFTLAA